MSDSDDGSVNYFEDDDFIDSGTPEAAPESSRSDDIPRAAKRRRLSRRGGNNPESAQRGRIRSETYGEDNSEEDSEAHGSDSFIEDDKGGESPDRSSSVEFDEQPKSKYKIFYPKHSNIQEETFVTQLT